MLLVDQREPVAAREVDEQQVDVLEGGVGDRHEERRARLVGVPLVEVEEAGQRGGQRGPARLDLHLRPPVEVDQPVDLGVERLAREGRHLPRLGQQVEHPQHVEAVVVGEEQLRAVARARARPGARGPLDEGAHAARRVEVPEVEAGQARARDAQEGLLQLRERHRRVGARVLEDVRADGHPEADPAALAVEDRLEEGIGEGVGQAGRSASRGPRRGQAWDEGSVGVVAIASPFPVGSRAPGTYSAMITAVSYGPPRGGVNGAGPTQRSRRSGARQQLRRHPL